MALLESIVGAGIGLLGQELLADDSKQAAVEDALEASRPITTVGPTGEARFDGDKMRLRLTPQLQAQATRLNIPIHSLLGTLSETDFEGREMAELDRLREIRRPEIARSRDALQARLLARGRSGLGVGGGRSGRLFNPQSAALEEAILAADLGDIGAARDFAREDERFALQQLTGLSQLQRGILKEPESLAALARGFAPPAAISALQAVPGMERGQRRESFFGALGQRIGQSDRLTGLFT